MVLTVGLLALTGALLFLSGEFWPQPIWFWLPTFQVENPYQFGALRFGLTSEAGLNDGSAFPVVNPRIDAAHKTVELNGGVTVVCSGFLLGDNAGIAMGFGASALFGGYVLHLRTVH